MTQIACPPLSDKLMNYLSSVFPDETVNPDIVNPQRAYGRVEVIRHLRAVKQEQEDNPNVFTRHT